MRLLAALVLIMSLLAACGEERHDQNQGGE
jgi:hypothetical protein